MINKTKYLFFLLIFALFAGGCSLPWKKSAESQPSPEPVNAAPAETSNSGQLKKFATYQELRNFLEAQSLNIPLNYGNKEMLQGLDMASSPMRGSAVTGEAAATGGTDDYSRTNIQVAGVDEADIIKTDGEYIYALVYNDIYIIKAQPVEQARAVSKLSFNSRPSEFFLDSGRLVVIGNDDQMMQTAVYKTFRRQSAYTFVKVFDLRDSESPKQIRDLSMEGSYQDSRVIDKRLYLIINNFNSYISNEVVTPRLVDNGKILSTDCEKNDRCFAPDVYYFDIPYDSYNFTSINTLDLSDAEASVKSQTYLLSGSQNLYASAKNIYLSYAQYLDQNDLLLTVMRERLTDKLSADDRSRLSKIDEADSAVLSVREKKQKQLQLFQTFLSTRSTEESLVIELDLENALKQKYEAEAANLERTLIYKFSLGDEQPVYRANGFVPGTALNQFSFDEAENGDFRIATTRSGGLGLEGNTESYSNLYVLDSNLKQIGSVERLAPGERIYSVRFMGKRAYLVTFKQIDPLFVLDLSDRLSPKLLGELKVPGFSSYLHPYNENTLIGVGKDTTLDAYGNVKTGGIKLSLFDVSDPKNPRELDSYVSGGSGSDSLAISDHKAFLFSREKNLLALPASLTSVASNFRTYFSGALVFSIENMKFNLKGQVDHSDGGKYQRADYWCGYNCYDASVRRAVYINDAIYTFSNKYIKVNALSTLDPLQTIKLLPDSEADARVQPIEPPKPVIEEAINEPSVPTNPMGPTMPPVVVTEPEAPAEELLTPLVAPESTPEPATEPPLDPSL
ncbi:MAG: beta-propeller domain-containing protein [bacterium]|nr:beta-propeller domain-containing protein [bacterium]